MAEAEVTDPQVIAALDRITKLLEEILERMSQPSGLGSGGHG
jgi:hypothetical protein